MPAFPLWPPSRDRARNAEALEASEARDPFGHGLHLLAGCAFCALAGLSTATLEIASIALLAIAALRLPHTWRTMPALLAAAPLLALIAWTVWAMLSLAWSSDPAEGFGQLDAARMLLVIPALWPLMPQRRTLATCLVAGLCIQVLGQGLDAIGVTASKTDALNRHIGFGSHPGHVTLWLGAGALTAVALLRGATPRLRWAYGIAAVLLLLGSFVGGGRGSLIGLSAGVAALVAVAIRSVRLTRKQWALGLAVALLAAGTVAVARGGDIALAVARAREQIQRSETKGDPRSSAGYRLYWWPLAIEQWRTAPIIGTGAGSWQGWAQSLPETQALAAKLKTTPDRLILAHPHSTYLQTLGETGAIGGVLTLLLAVALGIRGAANARRDPVALAGFSTLALWAVSAAFEGNHITSRAVAAFALACAFAVLPGLLPPPAACRDH